VRKNLIATAAVATIAALSIAACGTDSADTEAVAQSETLTEAPADTSTPTPTPTPEPPSDKDGDGVPDDEDFRPKNADIQTEKQWDRDGDGVPNTKDDFPNDADYASGERGVVTNIVDGDTIDVAGVGRIRVIGIDTPERGECGFDKASTVMADLVLGETVILVPGARDNTDRYDRLLRYIDVGNQDAGLQLIKRGLAIARYDSRDGYGAHTREARYIKADNNSPDRTQNFCPAPPAPEPQPQQPSTGGAEPWNLPGPDLDCPDIGHRVIITGPDYHRLDADGDGIGCDSYG
jgi:endonuclease YncB( thermonuclease family)